MRLDDERLLDILDAIAAIERHTSGGRDEFDRDELIKVWCLRHLEVIGEAVARLSDDLRDRHPQAPWRQIVGMRNALIHGYFDIDWDEVWSAVEHDVPQLRDSIRAIRRSEGLSTDG